MVQSTTRSTRQDDDAPQRPSKRDRIRNLKIRRPVNSNVNSTEASAPQHPSLAAKSSIVGLQRPASSTSRVPTSSTSSTRGTTTTERMLSGRLDYQDIVRTTKAQQYQDNVEYQQIVGTTKAPQYTDEVVYQDIVRTTQMQDTTNPSTVVVGTKPTTTISPRTTSPGRTQPVHPVSTTELFRGTEPSTSTLMSSTKKSKPTQVTKSTTYQVLNNSSPELTKSTLAMPEFATTQSFSSEFQPSTISQSVLSTPSVTPRDGADGSEVKQSSEDGVRVSNEDLTQSQITTHNPVDLPSRPREELKQDLLEAIRRKISRNKVSSSSGAEQKAETGFEIPSQSSDLNRTPSSAKSSSLRAVRLATSSFSPLINSVSSTRPPFFRPISFPPRTSGGRLDIPKVKITFGIWFSISSCFMQPMLKVRIFVNIPEEKPGGVVKIPHVSHIQDKLKRLNAAITAGLKHDQEEKEREEAIHADWQGKDDFEEEEHVEEVEVRERIFSHTTFPLSSIAVFQFF